MIAAAFGVAVLAEPAFAETFDHLACSPVVVEDVAGEDLASVNAAAATDPGGVGRGGRVALDALDDRFDARGCKVRRARLQCASRARTSLDPAHPLAFVEGDETAAEMICYRVRCRHAGGRTNLVSDAFGTRPIGRLRSHLLCVPAA